MSNQQKIVANVCNLIPIGLSLQNPEQIRSKLTVLTLNNPSTILRTVLMVDSSVLKEFLVVDVGFNQSWVQLKHVNK